MDFQASQGSMMREAHRRLSEVVVPHACECAQRLIDFLCKHGVCPELNACTAPFHWMLSIYMSIMIAVATYLGLWNQHLLTALFVFVVPALHEMIERFVDVVPTALILFVIIASYNSQKRAQKRAQKSRTQTQIDEMHSRIVGPSSSVQQQSPPKTSSPLVQASASTPRRATTPLGRSI